MILFKKILLISPCLLLIFHLACAQENKDQTSNAGKADSEIERLVSQLGSDIYQERSSARGKWGRFLTFLFDQWKLVIWASRDGSQYSFSIYRF